MCSDINHPDVRLRPLTTIQKYEYHTRARARVNSPHKSVYNVYIEEKNGYDLRKHMETLFFHNVYTPPCLPEDLAAKPLVRSTNTAVDTL